MITTAVLAFALAFAGLVDGSFIATTGSPEAKALPAKTPANGAPADVPPMQVFIVRDANPGCEPDCAEWISAEGTVTGDTPAAFKRVFKQLGERKLPIFISSPGGQELAAFVIGRDIRKRGLAVAVERTILPGCEVSAAACKRPADAAPATGLAEGTQAFCASACVFILAAGSERVAPWWALIGVHRSTQVMVKYRDLYRVTRRLEGGQPVEVSRRRISRTTLSSGLIENNPEDRIYAPVRSYFKEMGIDNSIMIPMLETTHEGVHWLNRGELASMHVITRVGDPVSLLASPPAKDPASASGTAIAATGRAVLAIGNTVRFAVDLTFEHRGQDAFVPVLMKPLEAVAGDLRFVPAAAILMTDGNLYAAQPDAQDPRGPLRLKLPVTAFCTLRPSPSRLLWVEANDPEFGTAKLGMTLDLKKSIAMEGMLRAVCPNSPDPVLAPQAQTTPSQRLQPVAPAATVTTSVAAKPAATAVATANALGSIEMAEGLIELGQFKNARFFANVTAYYDKSSRQIQIKVWPVLGNLPMITDLMTAKIGTMVGSLFLAENPQHNVGPLITTVPVADFCGHYGSAGRQVSIELVMPRQPQMHPRASIEFEANYQFKRLAADACVRGTG